MAGEVSGQSGADLAPQVVVSVFIDQDAAEASTGRFA